ncbi:hypothetical protein JCM6882_005605, partial [Rhodosporidiobolus microsporus]
MEASYNGGPSAPRPYAPYLPHPTLPSSRSFSDEVALDMRQREAASTHAHHEAYQQNGHSHGGREGGLRSPPGRAGAGGAGGGSIAGHSRTGSTGSAVFPSRIRPRSQIASPYQNGDGRDSRLTALPFDRDEHPSALHEAAGTYGMDAQQEDARSLNLGGSRPASTVGPLHQYPQNGHGHGDHHPMQSTVSLGGESVRTTALDYLYLNEDGQGPNGDAGYENGGENGEDRGRENAQLTKQEAWYLLRSLVGQELRHEEGLLWKLKNLDPGGGGMEGLNGGSYDEYLDPQEAPILRYLIRHFLLTLPLIRDVSSDPDSNPDEVPTFWTEGLYPIIRAVHDADFSKPVDRGTSSTAPKLYGTSIRNALERFVSAGLKLSSATYETSDDDRGPASVPMHPQATSSSTRYNFQPSVPPPAEVVPPSSPGKISKRRSSTSAPSPPSSSSGRRFSLSRLFGGVDRSPVKTAQPMPHLPRSGSAHLPPPAPTPAGLAETAAPTPEYGSASEGEVPLSDDEPRRRSAGPARPDSGILPGPLSFNYAPAAAAASGRSAADFPPEEEVVDPPTATRADEDAAGVEELDLVRSDSRTTGLTGFDTASFVSAQESAARTVSGEESEAEGEDMGDVTARFPVAGLAVPTAAGAGGEALQRESSATGTVRAGGVSTDTEGFEYYPSDVANTPTQERTAMDFSAEAAAQSTPKGKGRAVDAEPYVVEDSAAPDSAAAHLPPLPPPIPHIPYLTPSSASPFPPAPAPSAPSTTPPPRPRTPISISPSNSMSSKSRRNRFGLASLLRNGRTRSNEEEESGSAESAEAPPAPNSPPAHSFPLPPVANLAPPSERADEKEDFVAHMTIPSDLLYPGQYASTSEGDAAVYQPRAALPPVLLPKGGVSWPYDAQVPFFRGPQFEELKWGGFEADVVGVRKGVFSHEEVGDPPTATRADEDAAGVEELDLVRSDSRTTGLTGFDTAS